LGFWGSEATRLLPKLRGAGSMPAA
jgi:hypothetical protein